LAAAFFAAALAFLRWILVGVDDPEEGLEELGDGAEGMESAENRLTELVGPW
jgi:hypothetical protein